MSTRLAVDSDHELKEFRESAFPKQPAIIRLLATVISYILHPLFIPVYISIFLVSFQPYLFASITTADKVITVIRFVVMYSFFPLVSVLLLKGLGFIESIQLKTKRERIIPLSICMIYYFWMWYVLKNQPENPATVISLSLGIFISSIAAWMANIYTKISLHTIAAGVMLAFMFQLSLTQSTNFSMYLSIALLLSGLVSTARFIVSDHSQGEVYGGLFLGILSQVIAAWLA